MAPIVHLGAWRRRNGKGKQTCYNNLHEPDHTIFKISLMGFTYHQLHSKTKWFQKWPIFFYYLCKTVKYWTVFTVYKIQMCLEKYSYFSLKDSLSLAKMGFIALWFYQKKCTLFQQDIFSGLCFHTHFWFGPDKSSFTISMSVVLLLNLFTVLVFCVLSSLKS